MTTSACTFFWSDAAGGLRGSLPLATHSEHSIDWSPGGGEIVFVSNREANEDQFFNYDLFALKVNDGSIRQLTSTENIEYGPDGHLMAASSCIKAASAASPISKQPWRTRTSGQSMRTERIGASWPP